MNRMKNTKRIAAVILALMMAAVPVYAEGDAFGEQTSSISASVQTGIGQFISDDGSVINFSDSAELAAMFSLDNVGNAVSGKLLLTSDVSCEYLVIGLGSDIEITAGGINMDCFIINVGTLTLNGGRYGEIENDNELIVNNFDSIDKIYNYSSVTVNAVPSGRTISYYDFEEGNTGISFADGCTMESEGIDSILKVPRYTIKQAETMAVFVSESAVRYYKDPNLMCSELGKESGALHFMKNVTIKDYSYMLTNSKGIELELSAEEGVTVKAEHDNLLRPYGSMIIHSGKYIGTTNTVLMSGGQLTVNGGEILSSNKNGTAVNMSSRDDKVIMTNGHTGKINMIQGSLDVSGGTVDELYIWDIYGNANVSLSGGTFGKITYLASDKTEKDITDLLADGYEFRENPDGTLSVVPETLTYINENGEETAVGYYTLITSDTNEISSDGWYVVDGEVITDGIYIHDADVNIILKDGSCLESTGELDEAIGISSAYVKIYGQSKNTGTITHAVRTPEEETTAHHEASGIVVLGGGTLNIYGGVIKSPSAEINALAVAGAGEACVYSAEIKGSIFPAIQRSFGSVLVPYIALYPDGRYSEDPAPFAARGYVSVKNSDGSYGITEGQTYDVTFVSDKVYTESCIGEYYISSNIYDYDDLPIQYIASMASWRNPDMLQKYVNAFSESMGNADVISEAELEAIKLVLEQDYTEQ